MTLAPPALPGRDERWKSNIKQHQTLPLPQTCFLLPVFVRSWKRTNELFSLLFTQNRDQLPPSGSRFHTTVGYSGTRNYSSIQLYKYIYIYRIAQLLLSHSQSALSECKPLRRMLAQEGPLKELVQL